MFSHDFTYPFNNPGWAPHAVDGKSKNDKKTWSVEWEYLTPDDDNAVCTKCGAAFVQGKCKYKHNIHDPRVIEIDTFGGFIKVRIRRYECNGLLLKDAYTGEVSVVAVDEITGCVEYEDIPYIEQPETGGYGQAIACKKVFDQILDENDINQEIGMTTKLYQYLLTRLRAGRHDAHIVTTLHKETAVSKKKVRKVRNHALRHP